MAEVEKKKGKKTPSNTRFEYSPDSVWGFSKMILNGEAQLD